MSFEKKPKTIANIACGSVRGRDLRIAEVVCGILVRVLCVFGGRVPRKVLRKCFAEALN